MTNLPNPSPLRACGRSLETPVLLVIFNRPDTTRVVFEAIRRVTPRQLFIAADGPREGRVEDVERCEATRAVAQQVDWECDLQTNFRSTNLGLKSCMSASIAWFFQQVEAGIILEDDCLPDESFFWMCQELLRRYRDDLRIMSITGTNLQDGQVRGEGTYYFSKVFGVWGWATWRRAWALFDPSLSTFPRFRDERQIENVCADRLSQRFWLTKIEDTYRGGNSWAFAWAYAMLANSGLCIVPNVNLVSNIGFGPDAVHSTDHRSRFNRIPTQALADLRHPSYIIPDVRADEYIIRVVAGEQLPKRNLVYGLKWLLRRIVGEQLYAKIRSRRSKLVERHTR